MNKNINNNSLVIIIVLVLIIAGYILVNPKSKYISQPSFSQTSQTTPIIQNSSDLTKASNDLNSTNTSELDTQLNMVNLDASTF